MIDLTPEEAMKKWCPWAVGFDIHNDRPVTVNRTMGGNPDQSCFCLANRCMAWRWQPWMDEEKPSKGYCGRVGG